jgi:hypothetical protein
MADAWGKEPGPKDNNMAGFNAAFKKAMQDAAGKWGDGAWKAKVEFEVTHKPNPGAVGEYRVKLTEI